MTEIDERLVSAIEGVLYRRGTAKTGTVAIEVSRMSELRKAFEMIRPPIKLEVHQKWVPSKGNKLERTIIEFNDHRVGFETQCGSGPTLQKSCSMAEWDTWVKNTQATCLKVSDYRH